MSLEDHRREVRRLCGVYAQHGTHPVGLMSGDIGVKLPAEGISIPFWLDTENNTGWWWWLECNETGDRVEPFDRISARWLGWDAFPPALLLVRDAAALARGYLPLEPGPAVSSYRLRSLPKATI